MSEMSVAQEIALFASARMHCIWMEALEEERALEDVASAASALDAEVFAWSLCGLRRFKTPAERQSKLDAWTAPEPMGPDEVMDAIATEPPPEGGVVPRRFFILLEFDEILEADIQVRRRFREVMLDSAQRKRTSLFVLTPRSGTVPHSIERTVTLMRYRVPTLDQHRAHILSTRESAERMAEARREQVKKSGGDADIQSAFRLDDEGIERLVNAAVGLTRSELDRAFKLSLQSPARAITEDTVATVLREKRRLIESTGYLQYEEPSASLADVGGQDLLKGWLARRMKAFGPKARAYGLSEPKGVLTVGPPGCVTGDTRLIYRRGKRNAGRPISVEDLFHKFNRTGERRNAKEWRQGIETFVHSFNTETGVVFYNRIRNVIDKGVRACIRVRTDSAGSVDLTLDHPVLTADRGFVAAGELKPGDRLTVKGSMLPTSSGGRRKAKPRVTVEGLKYYRGGSRKEVKEPTTGVVYKYRRQHRARLVIEAHMNGLLYEDYLEILRSDPVRAEKLQVLSSDFDVHHLDEDPLNDRLDNLQVMLRSEHLALHGHAAVERFSVDYTREAEVVSIESLGEHRVYDLEMDVPCHNFVVNDGIIVHNTGKSLGAKAAASAWGRPLVRLDIGALFGGIVGESESNTRRAIDLIEALAPCVLWIDEIEKGLSGMAGSGKTDGGTGARVMQNLLTWMNEKSSPVFIFATANDPTALPPELLRKGRMDEIFAVGLPTRLERVAILEIHIRKRGRDPADFDLARVAACTTGFSGAELEQVVVDALFGAFFEDREITTDDLVSAADATMPMSRTMIERIQELDHWASTRARPASSATDRPNRSVKAQPEEADVFEALGIS